MITPLLSALAITFAGTAIYVRWARRVWRRD